MSTISPFSYQVAQGRVAPIVVNWQGDKTCVIDFTSQKGVSNSIQGIKSVYVDNTQTAGTITLHVDGINIYINVQPGQSGIFPIYSHGLSRITVTNEVAEGRTSLFFADFSQPLYSFNVTEIAQEVTETTLKQMATESPLTQLPALMVYDPDTVDAITKFRNALTIKNGAVSVSDAALAEIFSRLTFFQASSGFPTELMVHDASILAAVNSIFDALKFSDENLMVVDKNSGSILSCLSGAARTTTISIPSGSSGVSYVGARVLCDISIYNSAAEQGFLFLYDAATSAGADVPIAVIPVSNSDEFIRDVCSSVKIPLTSGLFCKFTSDSAGANPVNFVSGEFSVFAKFI